MNMMENNTNGGRCDQSVGDSVDILSNSNSSTYRHNNAQQEQNFQAIQHVEMNSGFKFPTFNPSSNLNFKNKNNNHVNMSLPNDGRAYRFNEPIQQQQQQYPLSQWVPSPSSQNNVQQNVNFNNNSMYISNLHPYIPNGNANTMMITQERPINHTINPSNSQADISILPSSNITSIMQSNFGNNVSMDRTFQNGSLNTANIHNKPFSVGDVNGLGRVNNNIHLSNINNNTDYNNGQYNRFNSSMMMNFSNSNNLNSNCMFESQQEKYVQQTSSETNSRFMSSIAPPPPPPPPPITQKINSNVNNTFKNKNANKFRPLGSLPSSDNGFTANESPSMVNPLAPLSHHHFQQSDSSNMSFNKNKNKNKHSASKNNNINNEVIYSPAASNFHFTAQSADASKSSSKFNTAVNFNNKNSGSKGYLPFPPMVSTPNSNSSSTSNINNNNGFNTGGLIISKLEHSSTGLQPRLTNSSYDTSCFEDGTSPPPQFSLNSNVTSPACDPTVMSPFVSSRSINNFPYQQQQQHQQQPQQHFAYENKYSSFEAADLNRNSNQQEEEDYFLMMVTSNNHLNHADPIEQDHMHSFAPNVMMLSVSSPPPVDDRCNFIGPTSGGLFDKCPSLHEKYQSTITSSTTTACASASSNRNVLNNNCKGDLKNKRIHKGKSIANKDVSNKSSLEKTESVAAICDNDYETTNNHKQ